METIKNDLLENLKFSISNKSWHPFWFPFKENELDVRPLDSSFFMPESEHEEFDIPCQIPLRWKLTCMNRLIVIQSDPVAKSVRRAGRHPNVLGILGKRQREKWKWEGEERDRSGREQREYTHRHIERATVCWPGTHPCSRDRSDTSTLHPPCVVFIAASSFKHNLWPPPRASRILQAKNGALLGVPVVEGQPNPPTNSSIIFPFSYIVWNVSFLGIPQ